jgi:conjugal transfer pilin signal peptidase TrbI
LGLARKVWTTRWSFWAIMVLGACALIFTGILLSPFRIGIDVARLLGHESCLPSLVYIIDYRPNRYHLERWSYPVFSFPRTEQWDQHRWGPPPGVKAIKLAAAIPGDRVKIEGTELYINFVHRDRLWLAKSIPNKDVGDFDAEYIIPEGMFFAYGTEKGSFDSRYFGPLPTAAIVGYARPVF